MRISILRPLLSWILLDDYIDGKLVPGGDWNLCVSPFNTGRFITVWLISKWSRPPSWIFSHVNTNGKSGSGGPFSGTVSNLVQINAIMSELWPFNWFQNGGCRHLGLLFGNPGPEVCVNISCQSHNRITAFRDMVIWKFCKFGLKRLFPAQKFTSLVVLMPKH